MLENKVQTSLTCLLEFKTINTGEYPILLHVEKPNLFTPGLKDMTNSNHLFLQ